MGRKWTGAETCEGSKRIELSFLFKEGFLIEGERTCSAIYWSDNHGNKTADINLIADMKGAEKFIRLLYTITHRKSKQVSRFDYKIYLTWIPSNLGKGKVWYFLCPVTQKRCRVLYLAYGSKTWKSREAYSKRLYYRAQTESKLNYANSRYWVYKKRLEDARPRKFYKRKYRGKLTRTALKIFKLESKEEYWDYRRWLPSSMPKVVRENIHSMLGI